ncbi:trimeric LpxA-like protein [Bimuria novae-zelandiae CBS 107.79]|uniref:Dynactin subunit 6 n=1 Tax=Bimuria novae-zelandiae CBS 107.79 TaxID=1447943 RepID=A0A6A5US13_9PLEO|nr:trimeric LpxA-like protein [Bimuria novae-zelandiae CBS 107.79]
MSAPTPSRPDAARRTSTMKRASILPKHPSLFVDHTVLIAQHAGFTGTQPITVGPNVVLHPHAKVSSSLAPIVLGEGVVLWERARVGVSMAEAMNDSRRSSVASRASSVRDSTRGEGIVLGRNVTIEAAAVVEAAEVGEGSVIEVGAYLGKGCVIGKYCTIVAHCVIPPNTQIPDYMVVQSATDYRLNRTLLMRPEVLDMRMNFHTMQIQTFKRLVPNSIAKWIS